MGCTKSSRLHFSKILGSLLYVNYEILGDVIPGEAEALDDWTQQFVGIQ